MMKNRHCAICLARVEREDAPILTMSGSGVPRFLCDDCAADIDTATLGREYDAISAAMDRIASNLTDKNIDDPWTLNTATSILSASAARAKKIGEGEYDFSLDEAEDTDLNEIPEDMLESEADKELDAEEEKRADKIDRVLNWLWAVLIIGILGLMVWWLFFR